MLLLAAAGVVAAASGSVRGETPGAGLRAGAAKRAVAPTQPQIDGITEPRLAGTTHLQKFNLGGFGVNPLQNAPDPIGELGEELTEPASVRVFTGSHGEEPIWLRVLVIDEAGGERVAFVTLDATGAGNLVQDGVKRAVRDASCALDACIEPANVIFGQTHTHAGPDLQGLWGGVPQDWVENVLYAAAADAVRDAVASLEPARLRVRRGETLAFNSYRRPRLDPAAEADGALTLLSVSGAESARPIASILQYSAHPTSVNEDPRIPHADYVLGATDWLEDGAHLGGVALYYNGPIADASPSGSREGCAPAATDAKYGEVRCRGEGIADAALALEDRELAPTLDVRHREVALPITNPLFLAAAAAGAFNRYYDFAMLPIAEIPGIGPALASEVPNLPQAIPLARTLVSRVTLGGAAGGLEIVTIPGEATNGFGRSVRRLAKTDVMLLGLTHNSFGYVIPEEEFNYVDESGEAGFLVPFTGYEEWVSLGPLTAPLLRIQGYNRLFDAPAEADVPPAIAACADLASDECLVSAVARHVDYVQRTYAAKCRDGGAPAELCALLDPETPLAGPCREAGLPEGVCSALGGSEESGSADGELLQPAAEALARGCDVLDPAHCLLPFPNDHFTVAAPAGSPQSATRGGSGRRVHLSSLAMPRNLVGKPIDPTEWNRNDGFSPGSMIVTYVPSLGTVNGENGKPRGPIVGGPPITDVSRSLDVAGSSVVVLDAATAEPHLVWAEVDLNAGLLLPSEGVASLSPARPALIVRPAVNFEDGHRYVVVLKSLVDRGGAAIPAQPAFRVCRDRVGSSLPPVAERCAALEASVFPVLDAAGIARDESLYLAWDFTVASTDNTIGRLRHMRDDAFRNGLGQKEDESGAIVDLGRPPPFKVTEIIERPNAELARVVKGTFVVPSYVVPPDPSPLDGSSDLTGLLADVGRNLPDEVGLGIVDGEDIGTILASGNLPPNRLFYDPTDAPNPADPEGLLWGDGLPDRTGDMTVTFTCNIPFAAVSGKPFPKAVPADVRPARPSVYGHGLLGGQGEVGAGNVRAMGNEHDVMFCAADWYGFATGDLPNIVTALADMSNFPVIPDASQQGMLNQMFLARLLRHPRGFARHGAFQVDGRPVFTPGDVFYDGNSQGGILAGPLVAASKDIRRAVLGVPGMNYSTLLQRSVDFDLYSVPVYLNYQDDLDRQLLFALIQMLWDRSENDGFAHHLKDNAALGGPAKQVLLHPAFSDHQVSMWTAEVLARTVGARVDRSRVTPERHPDDVEYFGIEALDFADPAHRAGSALVVWDNLEQPPPPIGNVPPREGADPHSFPRSQRVGRCQKSHFLRADGEVIAVPARDAGAESFVCP